MNNAKSKGQIARVGRAEDVQPAWDLQSAGHEADLEPLGGVKLLVSISLKPYKVKYRRKQAILSLCTSIHIIYHVRTSF